MQLETTKPAIKPSALAVMASRYNVEPAKLLETLKATVFKGATDAELLALVVVANEYGLSPLTKEIFAFPAKGGGIVPVVSIDGWLNRMNSNPQFDGVDFEDIYNDGAFVATTCTIWRKDRSHPIRVTEYLSECKRNTEPWKMEHRMLRHKALIQCVRVAFGFSGVYDEDEASRIAALPQANAMPVIKVDAPKAKKKDAEPTPRELLYMKVQEAGYTPELAYSAIHQMQFAGEATTFAELDETTVGELLKSFDVVLLPTLQKLFTAK